MEKRKIKIKTSKLFDLVTQNQKDYFNAYKIIEKLSKYLRKRGLIIVEDGDC